MRLPLDDGSGPGANWPDKPVKMIVPYAPGGASDLIAPALGGGADKAFGQQFVVENRGGARGMIGTEAAFKSAPDGYTFLHDAECDADSCCRTCARRPTSR